MVTEQASICVEMILHSFLARAFPGFTACQDDEIGFMILDRNVYRFPAAVIFKYPSYFMAATVLTVISSGQPSS